MTSRIEKIRARIEEALAPTSIKLLDDSRSHAGHAGAIESGGGHFSATIVASAFEGKTLVQRHQRVYGALGEMMRIGNETVMLAQKRKKDETLIGAASVLGRHTSLAIEALTKQLVVRAEAFSAGARTKIEEAGGRCEVVKHPVAPIVRHKNKKK